MLPAHVNYRAGTKSVPTIGHNAQIYLILMRACEQRLLASSKYLFPGVAGVREGMLLAVATQGDLRFMLLGLSSFH
jgi:hypothetical protein